MDHQPGFSELEFAGKRKQTLLKFRRLLEKKDLCATIFETINAHLEQEGMLLREGTLVD